MNKKQVIAYEADGVRIFESVSAAARHYGLANSQIYILLHSGGTTADGVSFDYTRVQF